MTADDDPDCVRRPTESHRSAYVNHGCRCAECRAAMTAYQRRRTATRTERLTAAPWLVTHGTENAYMNWGCRCRGCMDAHAAAVRARRRRRLDAAKDDDVGA